MSATTPDECVQEGAGLAQPTFSPATSAAQSCAQLLRQARPGFAARAGRTLRFDGVGDKDVYNIAAPFEFDGTRLLPGRVESRSTEFSQIVLFAEDREGVWRPHFTCEQFVGLQDPCVTFVDDELVLGGVRFPVRLPNGDNAGWVMDFYRGKSLTGLRHFLRGPDKMKDIRLRQLPDGRVAVFSRPQGAKGGRGQIGFAIAPDLRGVDADLIQDAPLIPGQFLESEWGGANEVHVLANGTLGVLGHIASFDPQEHRHYYPMAFCLDPAAGRVSPVRIIACRDLFPPGPSKRPDLADVVFSGGLVRHGDGAATLYAGVSDAGAACVDIPDPFAMYE